MASLWDIPKPLKPETITGLKEARPLPPVDEPPVPQPTDTTPLPPAARPLLSREEQVRFTKRDDQSQYMAGLGRATDELQAAAWGAGEAVTRSIGRGAGALQEAARNAGYGPEVTDRLEAFRGGAEELAYKMNMEHERNMLEAQQHTDPTVESVTDIRGVEDFGDWAAYTLGTLTPSVLTSVVGGGGGALAGAALRGATKLGAMGGLYGSSFVPQYGQLYKEIQEGGVEAPGKAALGAAAQAGLDVLPQAKILRMLGAPPGAKRSVVGSAVRGALQQMPYEAATEAGQEAIGMVTRAQADPNFQPTGREIGGRLLEAGAAGALGGAAGGGMGGLMGGLRERMARLRQNMTVMPPRPQPALSQDIGEGTPETGVDEEGNETTADQTLMVPGTEESLMGGYNIPGLDYERLGGVYETDVSRQARGAREFASTAQQKAQERVAQLNREYIQSQLGEPSPETLARAERGLGALPDEEAGDIVRKAQESLDFIRNHQLEDIPLEIAGKGTLSLTALDDLLPERFASQLFREDEGTITGRDLADRLGKIAEGMKGAEGLPETQEISNPRAESASPFIIEPLSKLVEEEAQQKFPPEAGYGPDDQIQYMADKAVEMWRENSGQHRIEALEGKVARMQELEGILENADLLPQDYRITLESQRDNLYDELDALADEIGTSTQPGSLAAFESQITEADVRADPVAYLSRFEQITRKTEPTSSFELTDRQIKGTRGQRGVLWKRGKSKMSQAAEGAFPTGRMFGGNVQEMVNFRNLTAMAEKARQEEQTRARFPRHERGELSMQDQAFEDALTGIGMLADYIEKTTAKPGKPGVKILPKRGIMMLPSDLKIKGTPTAARAQEALKPKGKADFQKGVSPSQRRVRKAYEALLEMVGPDTQFSAKLPGVTFRQALEQYTGMSFATKKQEEKRPAMEENFPSPDEREIAVGKAMSRGYEAAQRDQEQGVGEGATNTSLQKMKPRDKGEVLAGGITSSPEPGPFLYEPYRGALASPKKQARTMARLTSEDLKPIDAQLKDIVARVKEIQRFYRVPREPKPGEVERIVAQAKGSLTRAINYYSTIKSGHEKKLREIRQRYQLAKRDVEQATDPKDKRNALARLRRAKKRGLEVAGEFKHGMTPEMMETLGRTEPTGGWRGEFYDKMIDWSRKQLQKVKNGTYAKEIEAAIRKGEPDPAEIVQYREAYGQLLRERNAIQRVVDRYTKKAKEKTGGGPPPEPDLPPEPYRPTEEVYQEELERQAKTEAARRAAEQRKIEEAERVMGYQRMFEADRKAEAEARKKRGEPEKKETEREKLAREIAELALVKKRILEEAYKEQGKVPRVDDARVVAEARAEFPTEGTISAAALRKAMEDARQTWFRASKRNISKLKASMNIDPSTPQELNGKDLTPIKKAMAKMLSGVRVPNQIELLEPKQAEAILKAEGRLDLYEGILNGSTHGFTMPVEKGKIRMFVHPGLEGEVMQEILAHELGHAVYRSYAESLDEKTASDILKQYTRWRKKFGRDNTNLEKLVRSKKTAKAALLVLNGDAHTRSLSDLKGTQQEYLLDFEEWFADQVSHWLVRRTTAPTTAVQRFFKAIADAIRALWTGAGNPFGSVHRYLDSLTGGPRHWDQPFTAVEAVAPSIGLSSNNGDVVASLKKLMGKDWKPDAKEVAYWSTLHEADRYSAAFNDSFTKWLLPNLPEGTRAMLGRVALSPTIQRQLFTEVGSDPVSAIMIKDPDYATAYMYQLWSQGRIKLGQRTDSLFFRIAKAAKDTLGVIADMDNAEQIFGQLRDGHMRAKANNGRFVIQRTMPGSVAEKAVQALNPLYEKVAGPTGIATKLLVSMDDRLRMASNPAMTELANLLHTEAGGIQSRPTYHQNKLRYIGRFHNISRRIWEGKNAKFGDEALEYLYGVKDIKDAPADMRKAVQQTWDMYREMYTYQKRAGVEIKDSGENYFPWVLDIDKMEANKQDFIQMLMQDKYNKEVLKLAIARNQKRLRKYSHDHDLKLRDRDIDQMAEQAARGQETEYTKEARLVDKEGIANLYYDEAMAANGVFEQRMDPDLADEDIIPYSRFLNNRVLRFVEPADMRPFLEDEIGMVNGLYIDNAVKHTEYARIFGAGGEKFDSLIEKAKKNGASDKDIELMRQSLAATLGTHGMKTAIWLNKTLGIPLPRINSPINDTVSSLMGTFIVAQNVILLGLSTLTSLADPVGLAVRSGDLNTAFRGVKSLMKKSDRKQLNDIGEALGLVEQATLSEAMGYRYDGMYLTGKNRRVNEWFFRTIGLNSWTRLTRLMGLATAQAFLRKHAHNPNKHSERFLQEMGLTAEDVHLNEDGSIKILTTEERRAADPKEMVRDERVRNALMQFVEESILRPNPSMRTIWGSDPHFMLFQYLKSFTYSFQKRILGRTFHEAMEGNFTGAAQLLWFIPVMLAIDLLREMIQHGPDGDPRKDAWDFWDYVTNAASRAGMAGTGQQLLDVDQDIAYGGIGIEGMFASVDTFNNMVDAIGGNENAFEKLWPFSPVTRHYLGD